MDGENEVDFKAEWLLEVLYFLCDAKIDILSKATMEIKDLAVLVGFYSRPTRIRSIFSVNSIL